MAELLPMSEATVLALHAMACVARAAGPLGASPIAASLSASEAHVAKVLQRLVHAGLLRSKRGPQGGYELSRPADQIRLADVYRTFERPVRTDGCLFAAPVCQSQRCLFGDFVGDVRQRIAAYLEETTLDRVSSA